MADETRQAAVVRPQEAVFQPVARARGASMAVLLGPSLGAERIVTRHFRLAPGGVIPAHRHDTIEHQQVVLRGEMVLRMDGVEHLVRPGDAVLIPAGCAHAYANRGAEDVEFLCVIPNSADYATEWLEDAPPGAFLPPDPARR